VHEAALRSAARAAEQERQERRRARALAVRRRTTDRLPRLTPRGRATGTLARRRRVRTSLLLAAVGAVDVLVWVVRPDWATRLGILVVSVLVAPVLVALAAPRSR
jgi:hypothetical protein